MAAWRQLRDGRDRADRSADRCTYAGSGRTGPVGAFVVMAGGGDACQRRRLHRSNPSAWRGAAGCPSRARGVVLLSTRCRAVRAGSNDRRCDTGWPRRDRAGVDRLRGRGIGVATYSNPLRNAAFGFSGMTALLRATTLRVAYGDVHVLDAIDLEIARGEFVALIGPNGAGKTTLLHAIAGTVPMCGGAIDIAGHDLAKAPRDAKLAIGLAVDPASLPVLLTGR
ncbi:MAG: ATP-binding cassette domain-containing protein, partial [Rhodanobacteraceae bacterium]